MSQFEMRVNWLETPTADEAFGPELSTWASLEILLNGELITNNHPAFELWAADQAFVVGGMSGIAEWIVDWWMPIHYEAHTPFPKNLSPKPGRTPARLPSMRDAFLGWSGFLSDYDDLDSDQIADWQQRHTLGETSTDVALPSIVFLREGAWMAIGLDHVPAALGPTVRFSAPGAPGAWPAAPFWVPVRDVTCALQEFVDATNNKALLCADSRHWAEWLHARWVEVRASEAQPELLRTWMYGPVVSRAWSTLQNRLKQRMDALSGILSESQLVESTSDLDWLADEVSKTPFSRADLPSANVDWSVAPHHEGYRLAQRIRKDLKLEDRPIAGDLRESLLGKYGIEGRPLDSHGLFRSAAWMNSREAVLLWDEASPTYGRERPARFSIAAALGRLLASQPKSGYSAVAHSSQSYWRASQLANAFAAELLLPKQAILKRGADIQALSTEFGISRSATEWHVVNRYDQSEL
jgi:hypothetical protein